MTDFQSLGISPILVQAVSALGFETPTPIQREGIPLVLAGHDIMGLAQTGTGKTAAFGLPLVHHLLSEGTKPASKTVRALILAPTRELANQIAANLRDYVRRTHLRVGCVVGGSSIHVQMKNLGRGTDILVATPGRLLDLVERRAVQLETAKYLVLDEADQMLDLGFIHALRRIAKLLGTPRQTMLFSATMPKQIEDLARTYLRDPVRIEMNPPGKAADKVTQCVHFMDQKAKTEFLKDRLIERRDDLSLVFCRTKHGAEKLKKHLVECGFKAGSIHGNKSQGQRDRAIREFKSGEIRILVATDVAARGIDIPGVSHVYNFHLPEVAENYVHRIGRTARAGAAGEAVAFCAPEEIKLLRDIEKLMKIEIEVASGEVPANRKSGPPRGNGNAGGRGRGQGRNGTAHSKNGKAKSNASKGKRRPRREDVDKPREMDPNVHVTAAKSDHKAGKPSGKPSRKARKHQRESTPTNAAAGTNGNAPARHGQKSRKHGGGSANSNRPHGGSGNAPRSAGKNRRPNRRPAAA